MTRQHDEGEPPLVRPYIVGRLGEPAPPAEAESRPAWAVERPEVLPAYPDPATAVPSHRAGGTRPVPPPHRRLLLAGLALILASIAGLGLAVALRPAPQQALPPDIPLIRIPPSALVPTTDPPRPSDSRWPEPDSPPGTDAPDTDTPDTDTPATIPAAATAPGKPHTPRPSRTTVRPAPTPTLSPVPTVARPGVFRTDAGFCLTYTGGYPYGGEFVQVFGCMNGAPGQMWTLATDGTLRAFDKCARAETDGAVRVSFCDGNAAAQWRAGRKKSLVNVATNDCLTASWAGGYRVVVRVKDCTGATDQQWQLP